MKNSIVITGILLMLLLVGGWFYRDALSFFHSQSPEEDKGETNDQANTTEGLIISGGDGSITSSTPLSFAHTDSPSSFTGEGITSSGGSTSPFTVDKAGNIGIGTTTPARALDIFESDSVAQLRLSKTSDQYSEFTVNSVGDLRIKATGGDLLMLSENLRVCDNGACPKLHLTGKGNISVENAIEFGNGVYMKNTSDTEVKVYDNDSNAMLIFDEE